MIYLDYNASCPPPPAVIDVVTATLDDAARGALGNPSSSHAAGRRARAIIETAREAVADSADVAPRDVVLTSGATEALGLAIHGTVAALERDAPGAARPHVIASAIEHEAVLAALQTEVARGRIDLSIVAPDAEGIVDAGRVEDALRDETRLVCLLAAQNEVGAVQPFGAIAALCHRAGAVYLCDAVQGPGRGISLASIDADLIAISGHKIGAPPGIGALIRRRPNALVAMIEGGPQEGGLRAGTENTPAAAGFACAIERLAYDEDVEVARCEGLRARLVEGLGRLDRPVSILGPAERGRRLPQTVAVHIPESDSEAIVAALDLEGVAVSAGSACASGALATSHVLTAMGLDERAARGVIRISFGWASTEADIDGALEALRRVLTRF